jgi:hypothetical protein
LYLSPVLEHSGTGLGLFIPVPDWHQHFCIPVTDWPDAGQSNIPAFKKRVHPVVGKSRPNT